MKKIILTNGIIAGVIVSCLMLFTMNYYSHCNGNVDFDKGLIIGYATMLLGLSLIYVGIRRCRDEYNDGVISFGEAFKIGFLIALIASTLYVLSWLVDYYWFIPDFMDKYAASMLAKLKASGATQAVIDKQAQENADMHKMYQNPLLNALMTYMEILPVGVVITLISALVLKRKVEKGE